VRKIFGLLTVSCSDVFPAAALAQQPIRVIAVGPLDRFEGAGVAGRLRLQHRFALFLLRTNQWTSDPRFSSPNAITPAARGDLFVPLPTAFTIESSLRRELWPSPKGGASVFT